MTNAAPKVRAERVAEGVLEIVLDRPDAANAIDLGLAIELGAVARACASDRTLRAVVLTGAGPRFFCGGGDLKTFVGIGAALPPLLRDITMHLHGALLSFARMDAPLITAVNGAAAGGGFGLALAGDICLAARSATFRSAYTAIGLSPDVGTSFWLPRLVGLRRAQELVLTNRVLDADTAHAWGIVTEVVDDARLRERSIAFARDLAKLEVASLGASKRLVTASLGADLASHLDAEAQGIATRSEDPAAVALVTAFATRGRSKTAELTRDQSPWPTACESCCAVPSSCAQPSAVGPEPSPWNANNVPFGVSPLPPKTA